MKSKKDFLLLSLLMQLLFVINTFSQVTEKCGTFSPENLAKIVKGCSRPSFNQAHIAVQTDYPSFIQFHCSKQILIYNLIPNEVKNNIII